MATKEVDLLGEAIANTEREIFDEATGKQPSTKRTDEEVDTSLEDMGEGLEGQHEDDAGDEAEDGEEQGDDEGETRERDPETGKFVAKSEKEPEAEAATEDTAQEPEPKGKGAIPPGRLREQTEKATAAEARAKAAEEREAAANAKASADLATLNARIDGILQATRQPPKPEPKVEAPPEPDMFADPEGWKAWNKAQITAELSGLSQSFEARLVESSMGAAHEVHKEAFEKAYTSLTALDKTDPSARATVQRIWKSPNPGGALMRWHREQETLREVGPDPSKYREKVVTETREALMKDPEFRAQLLADLKAEASGGNGGQARHTTKLPKSLNGAAGGQSAQRINPNLYDNSERAVFESAFDD